MSTKIWIPTEPTVGERCNTIRLYGVPVAAEASSLEIQVNVCHMWREAMTKSTRMDGAVRLHLYAWLREAIIFS